MKKQEFYTLQEVAKMLRISERSMYRHIKSGKLTATKVGYWRIKEKDLNAFIESRANAGLKKKQ